jgi:hypothetical protein
VPLNKFEEGKEYVVPIRRALLLSASEIKFGPVRPTERARRTLAIKNTWGANIAVTLSDPIGNIFAWIPVHNRPLAKGCLHECRPRLFFAPSGAGSLLGTLAITTVDCPRTVKLEGRVQSIPGPIP